MAQFSYRIIPLAALALAVPAQATVYLTVEQAQNQMFPRQSLTPQFRTLTAEQVAAIRKASGESPLSRDLRAWRAADGGWFIVDEVVGKHEFITYAVSLDSSGAIRDVEILDYREAYGGQVRDPRWRQQFVGKRAGQSLKLGGEIRNVSGATLSCKHITDGVRRVLATYAVALAHA
ncbi:FMN-binding protein [Novosphingobium sp. PhB165]|uniref:FMN-binding protein n=1 Tax=Novosphingobium sp. PhB165 TaxID=2485105 RepID=UPI00104BC907|nr:FMN-binding protein [Novosphingobium sp. PhB165]TCM13017.1 FMN-binding protein [Novosphingobium sp. PhB165]